MTAATLVDLLEERTTALRGGYRFLQDGKTLTAELKYPDLARQARAIAAQLQQQLAPGSRALLLYPPGLEFLAGFFGCLYAGVVAIPVPPPDSARLKRTLPRLQAILADAEPDLVLTTAALQQVERLAAALPGLQWLATDRVDLESPAWRAPPLQAESLAYLQYTSGSTTAPRGVMISHANVLHNLGYLRRGFAYDADSVSITWMPYFHDYGLVEGLLQPLYSNLPCYVLSPLSILRRPVRWLQAIDRYRATHTHGPNFAYELCLQRITPEQRQGLDLSSWRVAGNGAEPIRADTLRRFTEVFAPCGFRAEVFYPAYGLAEATLFVSARRHTEPPRDCLLLAEALAQHRVLPLEPNGSSEHSCRVVSCGEPQGVAQLRIVDPETRRTCPADRVGEIWVADPSVALGYWRKAEESRTTFQARLLDEPGAGPFLRTGDLGFLRDGELYITGRLKDLIIVGGVNHYAHDLEWTVQQHCPELRRDHCVVFSIERDSAEQLVVLAEPEVQCNDWTPLFRRIREVVADYHELSVAAIVLLDRGGILKTSSGKLQRSACRQAFLEGRLNGLATWQSQAAAAPVTKPSRRLLTDLQQWLCRQLAATLQLDPHAIDLHTPFAQYGLDSRAGVALVVALEDWLGGAELSPTLLWEYPSVAKLSEYLSRHGVETPPSGVEIAGPATPGAEPIAIVGMACRFPGASSPDEFWTLLREGRCTIRSSPRLPGVEAGFLDAVEDFDREFFGLSASEAQAMDPQQRLLLEVAWEALENASLTPAQLTGRRVGVFIGVNAGYVFLQFSRPESWNLINAHSGTGLAFCCTANRLSYHLNLHGPSLAIDTACSSSLVAVHQACQSLLNGECELALAGGTNLLLSSHLQLVLERAGMLSPSQRCKAFDAAANGYVRGEGCGLVVLKRLVDVQRDGDRVVALIRASVINQNGRGNGLTAPNPHAQEVLIRQALTQAGLAARDIDYVEAHGTGTRLGDPIEMSALQAALTEGRHPDERCWVGSVKTNIGHLEAAAGIAGLIKAVLSLQHAEIPPHLHLEQLNPLIRLAETPFAIPTRHEPWPRNGEPPSRPRRAAVSSFGFGGTNAHVILEQAPPVPAAEPLGDGRPPLNLFPLSAHSPAALRALAERYASYLKARPATPLQHLCFTLSTRRTHHPERLALCTTSVAELAEQLQTFAASGRVAEIRSGRAASQAPSVTFLFSGQGAQYLNMGRQLYESQPSFRAVLQECDALLRDDLEQPLLSVIFGDTPELLDQTAYTQPALFALEYALACLWRQWGVEPAALLGHSVGEYVAACLAGVFSMRDGLRLIAARGRLIQQLPQDGAMLAVNAEESYLSATIQDCADAVSIAAVNAPRNTVLSGHRTVLERLQERFLAAGLNSRFLPVSHAFHSPLLAPILDEFHALAAGVEYASPRLTWISNLDGRPMDRAPDPDYWTRHLRGTVRFADGIRHLGATHGVFLEIGPRPVLSGLGMQCLSDPQIQWLPSLHPAREDWAVLLESLAQCYVSGVPLDWQGFHQDCPRHRFSDLPTYPFQRSHYALPPPPSRAVDGTSPAAGQDEDTLPVSADGPADWSYIPQWEPVPLPVRPVQTEWLLLADTQGVGAALQAQLEQQGQSCILVTADLPASLPAGPKPLQVVCLWGLDWPPAAALDPATLPPFLDRFSHHLLALLHELSARRLQPVHLWLVTRAAVATTPDEGSATLDGLLQALLWGLGRVLRSEYPDWQIRLVDVSGTAAQAAQQLLQESGTADGRTEVCWRSGQRYAWRLQRQALDAAAAPLRLDGTWLISGGLGHLGLALAEWLAQQGVRHLLLLGRRPPGPEAADRLAALGAQGVIVDVRTLDICDYPALCALLDDIQRDRPPLQGVIHAAAVLDDGILHQQTAARFNAVLAPKVLGGWYLHRLTERLPLRYFILFASAAGLFGNPGQSAYAAANAFLDALAGYRQARGLAALSIDWSAWTEAAADPKVAQQLARHGLIPVAAKAGLSFLEHALQLDRPQLAFLPLVAGRTVDPLQPPGWDSTSVATGSASPPAGLLQRLQQRAPEQRKSELQEYILDLAAAILGCAPTAIDPYRGFFEQGLDSLNVVELRNRLQQDLSQPLPTTLPFDFPTAAALSDALLQQFGLVVAASSSPQVTPPPAPSAETAEAIAIIAIGCRMPGGMSSPEAFWTLLHDGVDAISEVPPNRWDIESYYHPDPEHPGTIVTRYGGFVAAVEQFDAGFFGISPREAGPLDPQQRLLLEVCWETLERAGLPPSRLLGSETGVFIGISNNDYAQRLNRRPEGIDAYLGTGNALSVAANRLSYTFGLEGPSLAIDTACSSSLVALHQACQSLRDHESDLAISGGVNLLLDPTISINHSRARMLAPDGRCKAFSAAADGMVRAEGCALVLLKRLSDALRDGDPILACIRGSAVNQDGRTSGLTVPNGPAQQRVLRRALRQAGLMPAAISYIEAHGTGTALGDPVEAGALTAVFGEARQQLTVGSVKTNIGHLEAAAGIAGVLKVVLALQHRLIPAHLHCQSRNPRIDWTNSPLRIPSATEAWPDEPGPRRAGVSSFGFGGTNAHVILEEAGTPPARELPALTRYLLPLSAKTETALQELARRYTSYLEATTEQPADICYTAACGRDHFSWRLAVVGDTLADLRTGLYAWLDGKPVGDLYYGMVEATRLTATTRGRPPPAATAGPTDWADLAARYVEGTGPDWTACYRELPLRRVLLPGYPFERQRYFVDPPAPPAPQPQAYRLYWVEEPDLPPLPRLTDHWLILADRGGWGELLAADLEDRGARCTVVHCAPANGSRRSLLPDDSAAIRTLLGELGTLRGIVHLWSLDNPSPSALTADSLLDAQRRSLGSVLHLVQALEKLSPAPPLWLLSRAAQAVVPEDRLQGLAQSPLWGLGRSLAIELPWVWGGLLDLPAGVPTAQLVTAVSCALYSSSEDSQRALRAGRWYVPRLRPWRPERRHAVVIRPDASYLISGGFGSLGRQFGHWLVQQGAKSLWLLGRQGPADAAARTYLNDLHALGVNTQVAALDVTAASALAAQLAEWQRLGPPLRGVIHAAGLNAETPLTDLDWPGCAELLAAKLQGGWALQSSTVELPLDFFITCSSIAALWGGQRQAAYSAANAFLDGLAAYRRAHGQAALSIQWGPLAGSTMLGEAVATELRSYGLYATPLARSLEDLSPLLSEGVVQVAVVAADWTRFVPLYQSRCATSLFSALPGSAALIQPPTSADATAVRPDSPAALRAWLTAQLSAVLQLPSHQLDAETPLPRLGLDSLLAVELRNRLQQLGYTVPLSDLLSELTLNGLVERLAVALAVPASRPPPAPARALAEQIIGDI
jgi:acyl transferase domain-containing protein/acyl-CoA synthetase (AMP-forming)/AMP-acid ligase II/acyl carrier protein